MRRREEISDIFNAPLMELVYHAATVHRMHNDPTMVQRCTLLSIKTGGAARSSVAHTHTAACPADRSSPTPRLTGCPENCSYCSQSSHWSKDTGTKATKLMSLEEVYEAAVRAKESGSTRFCMGAAWRGPSQVGDGQWKRVLDMVTRIRGLGMEVCTTLGMLTPDQARQLKDAGLTAYNHNIDTSPEYYEKITSTRKFEDRLRTIGAVRDAGISVCAGGIIGLGEGLTDRIGMIHTLATLPEHPESVPINSLVAIKGTPLETNDTPTAFDMVRCIATARIAMPRTVVRLSAGRITLSKSDQALCFMAGANSIFDGDKLLTTANNDRNEDLALFGELGLKSRPAFLPYKSGNKSSDGSEFGAEHAHEGGCCGGPKEEAPQAGGCCGGKAHAHH